jgi:hypothetical protein
MKETSVKTLDIDLISPARIPTGDRSNNEEFIL